MSPPDPIHEQLDLPGLGITRHGFEIDAIDGSRDRLQSYDLYLAIFPQEDDARHLHGIAGSWCERHSLAAKYRQSPARLHITLHAIASFPPDFVPRAVIDAAATAANIAIRHPQLSIVFDRVSGSTLKGGFVFLCDKRSNRGIASLRTALASSLRRAGLRPKPSAVPHMTLLYRCDIDIEHPIEPICWTANRLVLLLSHRGLHHHQWIQSISLHPYSGGERPATPS